MPALITRRALNQTLLATGIAITLGAPASWRASAQSNGVASGGIGLTRTEFEDYFGEGEATQSYAKYIDPTYGGPIYVGYDFAHHADGLLNFLELQWDAINQIGGLTVDVATEEVLTVLPDDARHVRQFWMGATPGGPISLRSEEYSSASLAAARSGRGTILVTYQERTGQLNSSSGIAQIVTAASIAVEA